MLVVRASDGAAWSIYRPELEHIETLQDLNDRVLSPLLQIPSDCIICINEEGVMLSDASVPRLRAIAGSPSASLVQSHKSGIVDLDSTSRLGEKRLFVFDRYYLEVTPEAAMEQLALTEDQVLTEPPLQPDDPWSSHVALSHHNLGAIQAVIDSIQMQRAALKVALTNLQQVLTSSTTSLATFREATRESTSTWQELLDGWQAAMDAVSHVRIIPGLVAKGHTRDTSVTSASGRKASTGEGEGEKVRHLGDYISRDKMTNVYEGCHKTLRDIRERDEKLDAILVEAKAAAQAIQADFDATGHLLDELSACRENALIGHKRIEEIAEEANELLDEQLQADCFQELAINDQHHREDVAFLVVQKNASTRFLLDTMQRVSSLQSDVAVIPPGLASLDHDCRTKTENFRHLARLEGLIPAYVATVVEIVRRRMFESLLEKQSSEITGRLDAVSSAEAQRRTSFRAQHAGKLPWEVKGLHSSTDNVAVAVDVKTAFFSGDLPELTPETVGQLKDSLRELERSRYGGQQGNLVSEAVRFLERAARDLEALEADFAELEAGAQPSLITSAARQRIEELEEQVRHLEESKERTARTLQSERSSREEELAQHHQRYAQLAALQASDEEARRVLQKKVSSLEQTATTHEQEKAKWRRDREDADREASKAKTLIAELTYRATRGLASVEKAEQKAKDAEARQTSAIAASDEIARQLGELDLLYTELQAEHNNLQHELSRANVARRELETQLEAAQAAQREMSGQIAEKDRQLRDHRGEAEMDRAVLERELQEARTALAERDSHIARHVNRTSTLDEVVAGLREQVVRWETLAGRKDEDLQAQHNAIETAEAEHAKTIEQLQRDLQRMQTLAREAVTAAGRIRDETQRVTTVLSAPSRKDTAANNGTQADASAADDSMSARDYATEPLETLLADLQAYNPDALTEAVKVKIESLTTVTKKWSKEAKAYRDKASKASASVGDRIAFRNFAVGDLALFLPTRNTAVPVWAAFNVSSPHHFLSATGTIAEQIKSREWIVARISSLSERIADPKDPSSNPYQLAPGTKYFMLEVTPWSSREATKGRRSTSGLKKTGESSVQQPADGEKTKAMTALRELPPNATDRAKSEFSIIDASPEKPSRTSVESDLPFQTPPERPGTAPSGLTRALQSAPSSPTEVRSAPQPSTSANPFPVLGTSPSGAQANWGASPPSTAFESAPSPSASPAFVIKKTPSVGSRSAASESGKRRLARPAIPIERAPASRPLSPRSTGTGSYVGMPRSASSASDIWSSSVNRRRSASQLQAMASSPAQGASQGEAVPPLPENKSLATQEAQLSDSRWTAMTDQLGTADTRGLPISPSNGGDQQRPKSSASKRDSFVGSLKESMLGGLARRESSQTTGRTAAWGAEEIKKKLKSPTLPSA